MPEATPFSLWTVGWLLWSAAMLLDFVAAACRKRRTFSEHVWGRWFREPWKRVVFLVFWQTCGVHFAFAGRGWYASGAAVAITAAPVAALVVWRERAMFSKLGKLLKAAGSKIGGGINWTLRHGSKVAGLLGGAAVGATVLGYPGVAAALKTGASLVGGAAGVDGELAQSAGALAGATIVVASVLRKYYLDAKPLIARIVASLKASEPVAPAAGK